MGRTSAAVRTALVLAGLLTACGSAPTPQAASSAATSATSTTTPPPPTTGAATTVPAVASTVPATTVGPITAPSAPATTVTSVPRRAPTPQLGAVGDAGQAIVVTAAEYGAATAMLTAYERTADGWQAVMGPWTANVGRNGFAPPGQKAEGDGRTPSGTYRFSFMFGVAPDPGVRFEYRQVPDESIVWDEDPSSPTYNQWVDLDDSGGGTDPEGMYQPVAYRHGAVIAYNTARTPGLGSGIFLHASTGRATAGCVSLPVDQLVAILRWLDPDEQPRIVMGVAS